MGVTGARVRAVLGARTPGPVGRWPEGPGGDGLRAEYARRFGTEPEGLWHAPGRLALMGEHTAASGGAALFVALPWGVTVAVGTDPEGSTHIAAPSGPLSDRHPSTRAVARSVADARESGRLGADRGIRVLIGSDLPEHASLGHSAAVGAAVSLALADLTGADRPTGATVDEGVVLAARAGHAVRVNLASARTTVLPFDLAGAGMRLVVLETGQLPRRDPRPVRAAELARAQDVLGPLRAVQDLPGTLRRLQNPVLRHRVEYAVTEVHRLNAAVGLLRAGRAAETGPILSASHLSLRRFDLPLPAVELAVETAARAGARGARLSGWAGTAFALVAEERVAGLESEVRKAFLARGWPPPRVRAALPSEGARRGA
ncbi:galactokinase family protein [Nocardiopsis sp. B62]|uniref:galactokinase family protein n=1 Tax=Nocardiopsis sp. B62 TaxID=2824874 RepID=UPI001B359D15|nr:galactokinase family protein [Nocardiopsis sp. B62]MBQ1084510.1 GHMP kinase [Nocardiopsis sp. B62]